MNAIKIVETVIEGSIQDADCGLFFTRSLSGDSMERLLTLNDYENNRTIIVDICLGWSYFEVFGLTEHEQEELKVFYDMVQSKFRYEQHHGQYESLDSYIESKEAQ